MIFHTSPSCFTYAMYIGIFSTVLSTRRSLPQRWKRRSSSAVFPVLNSFATAALYFCVNKKSSLAFHLKIKSLICLRAIYGKLPDRCRLRQEEVYECENCDGCPFAERCKKTDKNRKVRINRELTAMHQEVVKNLESIQGALLRMNRSIQVESTFGIRKK